MIQDVQVKHMTEPSIGCRKSCGWRRSTSVDLMLIYTPEKLTWQWTKPTIWRCISLLITICKYILSLHRLIRFGSLCLPQTQWKSGWRFFSTQQLIFKYLGMGSFKLYMSCFSTGTLRWFWSNYSDLTRVFTPNGGDLVKWDPLFPGKSRWRWNIISFGQMI